MILAGVCRATGHLLLEVFSKERSPGLIQDSSGDLCPVWTVVSDEQFGEEELVGEAADLRAAAAVDLVAATDEGKGPVERVLDAGVDHLGGGEDLLGLVEFLADAVVFVAGQVSGDGAGDHASG
jgi:hypothetical protein